MTDSHDPTYASNDPVDHESEYGAPETRSGTAARPERVSIAGNEFSWPVPDRTIRVGGRAISVEIAVVAAIYAFAGLWLLWQTKSLFSYLPDSLAGLFSSNAFEFAFTWIIFLVIAVLLYVVVGLLYIAYSLYRADPIGRGLSAVLFATLLLLCFTSARSGVLTTITLVSGVCSAALFLSPWARQVFAESPRRGTRPAPVVLAETVAISYFSLTALLVLITLPGLRFAGDIGSKIVFFVLFGGAACVAVFMGIRDLNGGRSRRGRLLMTAGAAVVFLGQLITGFGANIAVAIGIAGGILAPLWLVPSARDWFGDGPLTQPGVSSGPGTGQET